MADKAVDWRRLLDDVPAGIAVLKKDGSLLFVNRKVYESMGYMREDLQRIALEDVGRIVAEEDRERAKELLKLLLEGKYDDIPYPVVLRFVDSSGRKSWQQVRFCPTQALGDEAAILVFTDISENVEMERELVKLTELLSLINRTIRHDILNILSMILGYVECYREERDDYWLERIEDMVRRGSEIIEKISKLEKFGSAAINLREVFESILQSYPVKYSISGDGVVYGEELAAVFRNIIENAVKHGNATEITVSIEKGDGRYTIQIADNGKGIPDEIREKVFDEGFSFGSSAGKGEGLYLVRKIVEKCGGEIWVEHNKPCGTVFVIRLPESRLGEAKLIE